MTFYYNTLKSDNPLRRKEPSSFKLRQCFVEIRVVLHLFVQLVNRLVTLQREPGLKLASGNVAAVSHKLDTGFVGNPLETHLFMFDENIPTVTDRGLIRPSY